MKRSLLFFILFICSTVAFCQDLTGTWGGVIQARSSRNYASNQYFFLEIKQQGRSIWGTYNITDSNNNTIVRCLCSATASLPKKPNALINLYKERVVDYDKKIESTQPCEGFNSFILHYFVSADSTEYLTGKASFDVGVSNNDRASLLVVQKMSNKLLRNVDAYFPRLAKLVEKGKTEETKTVVADDPATGTIVEKKLIQTLQTMLEQNLPLRKW